MATTRFIVEDSGQKRATQGVWELFIRVRSEWDIFQEQEPLFIYTYAYLQLLSVIERMYPFMKREQNAKHRY